MLLKGVGLAAAALGLMAGPAEAGTIYVMGPSSNPINAVVSNLIASGYNVTYGGLNTRSDYSGFDQVWDLRFTTKLTSADITAMGSYMAGGGRMYLTGGSSTFDSVRNQSLVAFVDSVGGGQLGLADNSVTGNQIFTTEGQVVNQPNTLFGISYSGARTVTVNSGDGFLITRTTSPTRGSMVGWDFGDIAGKSDARMLVGFDFNGIFTNANSKKLTENLANYLAAPLAAVPEPSTMASGVIAGLAGLGVAWRRRSRPAVV